MLFQKKRITLKLRAHLQTVEGFICLFGIADAPSTVQWRVLFYGVYIIGPFAIVIFSRKMTSVSTNAYVTKL